ncbi:MAG: phosphoribosylamine--glycine ligase [Gemmatimonadetes bacterium]|nr:phosphoribosylamine--glycine ligase [Gemmatimonadota bacterium]
MKLLLVGHGGREHALLWKLHRDAPEADFFITRGNGGTADLATHLPLDPGDIPALADWALAQHIDLTVIGPEGPLADGIVDAFERHGLATFGPTRAASTIEASKAYAKELMRRAGVPTAASEVFQDPDAAEACVRRRGTPLVVKASGLAAGKGALVCDSPEAALAAVRSMLREQAFGTAGREVVIEEKLEGEEISVLGLTDGQRVLPMLPAQDHKRVGEGDTGPNTGGMGAYAPVSRVDGALLERVSREIFLPTLHALREEGRRFRGVLYAGLMLTEAGPKVVEFNARFGDPETQAVLPLLRSSLLEPLLAIARGDTLAGSRLEWEPGAALATVLASAGYPGAVRTGDELTIPTAVARAPDLLLFHAGTRREDGRLVTAGGRVLAVTAVAPTLAAAAARSREAAAAISFAGKHYRGDIGWRELERHARAS